MDKLPPPADGSLDEEADAFQRLRPRLFGIAYRILGSVSEAEDVVQDVWLRWQDADRGAVLNPGAFLAKITTRLAINVAQSARVRREAYIGPWLPEPVDTGVDPQVGAERGEALELAVLLVLEKLNPVERAAYVLREAFAYPYDEIAGIVQLTQANVRQIVSRARKRLSAERRDPVDTAELRRLLDAFVAAARHGDVAALESVLSADVVAYADGNGLRGVARLEVVGAERVARISAFVNKFIPGADFSMAEANGLPSLLIRRDGETVGLVSATISGDRIDGLYWVLAPEKLRAYERSSNRLVRQEP
ncbi:MULTISPECIES: RNA polymerase sigma-70 factor [unclassified Streptomyces]|uniref:RNA polymerase sigma-70 factor n=1 Tax=unclassified Streptomyces TaxID=2593676 RepID=UPI000F4F4DE6|nr:MULTISPECIES: RNA polymerase sigma-70 factor [unclassified Streptomyces]MDH6454827.1 RNA polymerase sigma-70 factor (TIGR02957 family) [Streptomyces sp. SAI-119]MDH6494619.1 RNA polymerase sigma-70 factor (TIGR02957 family) [Streptomyces sp. SAI-149]QUC58247.1 RNA polymerase sigma-70 factor [Streptomyces sp. A2-16]